jgi:hypothetical protein
MSKRKGLRAVFQNGKWQVAKADPELEEVRRFFEEHPEIERETFCRQATMREIARYREREAIAAGKTQIDPSLLQTRTQ